MRDRITTFFGRWYGGVAIWLPGGAIWVGGSLLGIEVQPIPLMFFMASLGYTIGNIWFSVQERRSRTKLNAYSYGLSPRNEFFRKTLRYPHLTGCDRCGVEHSSLESAWLFHRERAVWMAAHEPSLYKRECEFLDVLQPVINMKQVHLLDRYGKLDGGLNRKLYP